jgi:hypothetical protein
MTPEYGASAGMFYIDDQTIEYLRLTGRDAQVALVERYAKTAGLWAMIWRSRVRAAAGVRSLQRRPHHGRPVQSARAPADHRSRRARHRRDLEKARADEAEGKCRTAP